VIKQTGWLALLGGGEFSFGETLAADRAWLAKAAPGPIGFLLSLIHITEPTRRSNISDAVI
jgi:hypothetical protein